MKGLRVFLLPLYYVIHLGGARHCEGSVEVKNDHRSEFSNLKNWKNEAWKSQGFNRIRTRDLRDRGAMLNQLCYEATHWEEGKFIELISSR